MKIENTNRFKIQNISMSRYCEECDADEVHGTVTHKKAVYWFCTSCRLMTPGMDAPRYKKDMS